MKELEKDLLYIVIREYPYALRISADVLDVLALPAVSRLRRLVSVKWFTVRTTL